MRQDTAQVSRRAWATWRRTDGGAVVSPPTARAGPGSGADPYVTGKRGMEQAKRCRYPSMNNLSLYLYVGLSAACFSIFNASVKALPSRIHIIYVLPFVIVGGLIVALLGLILPKFVSYEHVR
jgi:hypothetical protein